MRNKLKATCAVLAAVTTFSVAFAANGTVVEAGNTGAVIESGSVLGGEELSGKDWLFTKNSGITLDKKNSAVRFETGSAGKLFTSYTPAVLGEEAENNLTASFCVTLEKVLKNGAFGFLFGSPKLKSAPENGGTFLYFGKDDNGFFYGLDTFGAENRTLLPKTPLSGDKANVGIAVSGKMRITLTINGAVAYVSQTDGETNPAGFLGFAQLGEESLSADNKTVASVSALRIENEYYMRPETTKSSFANFSGSEFNTKEWFLYSTAACPGGGLFVKDGAIRWDGAGQNSIFATRFKYSNFELVYDLFDVKNEASVGSDGVINAASFWQGVAFGVQGDDIETSFARRDERDCLIYFGASVNAVTGERTGDTEMGFIANGKYAATNVKFPAKYSAFSKGFKDKVTVRILVVDGKLSVGLKLADELAYYTLYEYEFEGGSTPYGFVALHGEGNQNIPGRKLNHGSHYTLDDIRITNYDVKPNLIKVGFTSNVLTPLKDYVYVDPWTNAYLIYNTLGK